MSGGHGAYGKNKMKVTVKMFRETEHGNKRRIYTHVFVSEQASKEAIFKKITEKFPQWELSQMIVTRVRSQNWRSSTSIK